MTVSVLVLAHWNGATLPDVLAALREQTRPADDVVVVESESDEAGAIAARAYPEARVLRSAARLYPGPARNAGLAALRGDVMLSLDGDCVPDRDWIEHAVRAFAEGNRVLGGAVLNARDSDTLGWAWYLSEFTPWLPGPARDLRDMPTCNSAYRTDVARTAGFPAVELLSADSLFHWGLRERLGERLRFVPGMRVRHRLTGMTTRGYLRRRLEHGISLARARRGFRPVGRAERAFWAVAGAVLLPAFYAARLLAHAAGHPDVPPARLAAALPLALAGLTLFAWGQALGAVLPMPPR